MAIDDERHSEIPIVNIDIPNLILAPSISPDLPVLLITYRRFSCFALCHVIRGVWCASIYCSHLKMNGQSLSTQFAYQSGHSLDQFEQVPLEVGNLVRATVDDIWQNRVPDAARDEEEQWERALRSFYTKATPENPGDA